MFILEIDKNIRELFWDPSIIIIGLMNNKQILIVDDKFSVTRMISEYLDSKDFRTLIAHNGVVALTEARIHKPDLILLDIMMPKMDGMAFIETFREESNIPIILLTAKIEETDKVYGLGLGADDYVTKPFSLAELVARIQAVLRRSDRYPFQVTCSLLIILKYFLTSMRL